MESPGSVHLPPVHSVLSLVGMLILFPRSGFCHPDINCCRSIHLSAPISPLVSCWKWEGKHSHTTRILEVRTVSRKKKLSWAEQIPQEVASVVAQTLQVRNRTLFHLPALSLKLKGICSLPILGASLVAQLVKNLPTMQETWV